METLGPRMRPHPPHPSPSSPTLLLLPLSLLALVLLPRLSKSRIALSLVNGDGSSGRVVIDTKEGRPMRAASRSLWTSHASWWACRALGFQTGHAIERYFSYSTTQGHRPEYFDLHCEQTPIGIHCSHYYRTRPIEGTSDEFRPDDVEVRCIDRVASEGKGCKRSVRDKEDGKEDDDDDEEEEEELFCETSESSRSHREATTRIGVVHFGGREYSLNAGCLGAEQGEIKEFVCLDDRRSCTRRLGLVCLETCIFATSASEARLSYDESRLDSRLAHPRSCSLDVRLETESYVIVYLAELKLHDCRSLNIVPYDGCFGETRIAEKGTNWTAHYRLFKCKRFTLQLNDTCGVRIGGLSRFELAYTSHPMVNLRPLSLVRRNDSESFTLRCGAYFADESGARFPLALTNLSFPLDAAATWFYEDLHSGLRRPLLSLGLRQGWPTLSFDLLITAKQLLQPELVAGSYHCVQPVFHSKEVRELDWSAEIIVVVTQPTCTVKVSDLDELRVFECRCRAVVVGRHAPVVTFRFDNSDLFDVFVLNSSGIMVADYRLMAVLKGSKNDSVHFEKLWRSNQSRHGEGWSHVFCNIFFEYPLDLPPSYAESRACIFLTRNDSRDDSLASLGKSRVVTTIVAFCLVVPLINFSSLCLLAYLQDRALRKAEEARKKSQTKGSSGVVRASGRYRSSGRRRSSKLPWDRDSTPAVTDSQQQRSRISTIEGLFARSMIRADSEGAPRRHSKL